MKERVAATSALSADSQYWAGCESEQVMRDAGLQVSRRVNVCRRLSTDDDQIGFLFVRYTEDFIGGFAEFNPVRRRTCQLGRVRNNFAKPCGVTPQRDLRVGRQVEVFLVHYVQERKRGLELRCQKNRVRHGGQGFRAEMRGEENSLEP